MSAMVKAGLLLFSFTVISIFLVATTQNDTKGLIQYNQEQLLLKRLGELIDDYDNDIVSERYQKEVVLHGIQQTLNIYPAKKAKKPIAYLVEHTYPNGYSGDIRLLTGFDIEFKLLGVRVIAHKETPGLGDRIERKKSDWILQFKGLSLSNPDKSQWSVKRDGGAFDQFTGATITPRAIVSATYQVLEYFQTHAIK